MATKGEKKLFLWIKYQYKCKATEQPPEQSTARGAPPLTAARLQDTEERMGGGVLKANAARNTSHRCVVQWLERGRGGLHLSFIHDKTLNPHELCPRFYYL